MSRLLATHPPIAERIAELDPSFKRQDLKTLAAAAAIDAERLRLDPAAEDWPRTSAFTPVPAEASATRVAALAGTFDEIQQEYAREARQAIPQSLHAFADSADAARVLLFALLRGADPQVAARQDALIAATCGSAMSARVHAALPAIAALPPALRLPCVQQLLPAVRRMTIAEREELRGLARQLAEADRRVDVFECCLALLLESAMNDDLEGREEHGSRTLKQSAAAARKLFAVLADQGTGDAEAAKQAYLSGAGHALAGAAGDFMRVEDWPEALQGSLRELAMLRPTEKKALIEGLVRTVAHDRRLSVVEGELLRTVCATLHCPLPPILSAG
jgi:hypothetical protein